MFLAEKLQRIIADFSMIDDPHERLSAVVDRARKIPPLPPAVRTEENRVRGCVSIVWITGELREGRCYFYSDAESPVVRGLLAFVADFFSGVSPAEVADSSLDPLESLGLLRNLSPTRRNGLASARTHIQELAQAWLLRSV